MLSMGDVFDATSATSPRRTCENKNLEAPCGRCLEISELSVNSPTSCSGFVATPRLHRVPTPVTRQKSIMWREQERSLEREVKKFRFRIFLPLGKLHAPP